MSPLKSQPGGEASQTSGGSVTSDASSAGLRPVPKKRTFLSRHASSLSESSGLGLDAQAGSVAVVPALRRSLQRGSSVSSSQSYLGQDEIPQKSLVSQSAQPFKSPDETSQQPLSDVCQVSYNSSLEREGRPPSLTRDRSVDDLSNNSHPKVLINLSHPSTATHSMHNFRPAMNSRSDASTDKSIPQKSSERYDETQRERAELNTVILHTGSIQDSDREDGVGTAMRQEELSLPQSTVGEFDNKK